MSSSQRSYALQTMSKTPGPSTDGAASAAQDENSVSRSLWTADSPFFDNVTMSAIVLDQLQQHIRFEDGPLYYLQGKNQVPGTARIEQLSFLYYH